jgi:transcriptional regulator with XRE-family HTH domain
MLKKIRQERGFTQAALAEKVSVTREYITMLESGAKKNPSLALLKRLAKALTVKVGELLGWIARLKVKLRTWRLERRLTQEELAKKVRVTKFYISQLETGLRGNPSLLVLRRLAKALGVSVGELMEWYPKQNFRSCCEPYIASRRTSQTRRLSSSEAMIPDPLWHEGVALWGHVLKVAELNENDPNLKSAWEALVVQARKYLAESDAERHGLSRNWRTPPPRQCERWKVGRLLE